MKKFILLIALAFLASCSNSPNAPKVALTKKIQLIQTSSGLEKHILAKASNVGDTIHLGNIYKDVPYTFILQNAGTEAINNLIVKPIQTKGYLQTRRDTLGLLALPDSQSIVPILELLVRSTGTSPWTNELIPDADTGYGAGSLDFYDGDSLIATYAVDFNIKIADLTVYLVYLPTAGVNNDGSPYSVPIQHTVVTNVGNCDIDLAVSVVNSTLTGQDTVIAHIPIGTNNDTLPGNMLGLTTQTLQSNCQFVNGQYDIIEYLHQ